jgi:thiol:disulfide interchange protein DsbA
MFRRLFFAVLFFPLISFAEDFVAGKDYEIINPAPALATEAAIPVTEFFSYGCPWCYRIEPALNTWVGVQGKKINVTRIPVIFNKEWIYYAKAYYTANLLGIEAKLSPLLFKAIQMDKQILTNNQALISFFIAQGVDKDIAESAFTHSTTIDMKVAEGTMIMGRFHVNAVPAIIIGNRYKVDLKMAQGEERFFKILDYLVTKASEKK